jgi:hypothetical protein
MPRYYPSIRAAASLLCYSASLEVAAAEPTLISQAYSAYESFDYDRTLDLLADVLKDPTTSATDRATAELYRGLVLFSKGQTQAAVDAFGAALASDPAVSLPPGTSPRIVELVESMRPPPPSGRQLVESMGPIPPSALQRCLRTVDPWVEPVVAGGLALGLVGAGLLYAAHRNERSAETAKWADNAARFQRQSRRQQTAGLALAIAGGSASLAAGLWRVGVILYPGGAGLAVATEQ